MSYDMQAAIDVLETFWSEGLSVGDFYGDFTGIATQLVYQAAIWPEYKLVFASQGVFTKALTLETQQESEIQFQLTNYGKLFGGFTKEGFKGSPRWYLLTALKTAIWGGFINLPDPVGLANWVGLLAPAGDAVGHALATDPEPATRGALLDLLKSVNWPVQWVQSVLGGLGGLDDAIASSGWDQSTRASLSALSKDVRARALTVANAAQYTTIVTPSGEQAQLAAPPVKPWYRNGAVLSAGALGVLAGGVTAVHRLKRSRG